MSGLARNGSSATPPSMWHVLHSMSISSWTVDSKTLRPVGPPSTGPPSVDPRPPAPPLPPPLPLVEPLKMPAPLLGWPDPDDAELLPHAPVAPAPRTGLPFLIHCTFPVTSGIRSDPVGCSTSITDRAKAPIRC